MRTYKHLPKRVVPLLMIALIGMLGASCNSYRGVAENDGIYSSETRVVVVEDEESKNNYYKQYFSTKVEQLEDLPEDDLIFTDIEAYSTTESLDEEGYVVVEENYDDEAYGAWGTNDGDITVNVYNTGWYGAGWYGGWYAGWYHPWGYPYWGWGGYWNYPYWGWGGHWGYFGNAWFWGGGFYRPLYWQNPYFYSPYYYGGHYGYASLNRGRSNLDYLNGRNSYIRDRSRVNTARSSYSRTEAARRYNNNAIRTSRYNVGRMPTNRGYTRPSTRTQRNYNQNERSNIRQNNTRPSNTRPSYSRPSRPSSGSFNGGGSSRGGGGGRSGGRGGRG